MLSKKLIFIVMLFALCTFSVRAESENSVAETEKTETLSTEVETLEVVPKTALYYGDKIVIVNKNHGVDSTLSRFGDKAVGFNGIKFDQGVTLTVYKTATDVGSSSEAVTFNSPVYLKTNDGLFLQRSKAFANPDEEINTGRFEVGFLGSATQTVTFTTDGDSESGEVYCGDDSETGIVFSGTAEDATKPDWSGKRFLTLRWDYVESFVSHYQSHESLTLFKV